ncbi:MAG: aldo/keto reductase [Hyphomonadaceae bacterium]
MSDARTIILKAFANGQPRLGFGTGDLFTDGRSGDSARVISAAFDAGFRYFDTARLYGDGQAEYAVGEALAGKRNDIILVSKAGIIPWSMRGGARVAHKASRLLGPLGKPFAKTPSAKMGAFTAAEMTRSVETSLRALRTDYVDILLLHECTLADATADETRNVLEQLLRAGKIRAHGIATTHANTRAILQDGRAAPAIVQAPADAIGGQIADYAGAKGVVITHSLLRPVLAALSTRSAADPGFAQRFKAEAGVDPTDAQALAPLLMAHALSANPTGVVLVSTRKAERAAGIQGAARRLDGASADVRRLATALWALNQ